MEEEKKESKNTNKRRKKVNIKLTMTIIGIGATLLFLLFIVAAIHELVLGSNNANQGTSDNAYILEGEKTENYLYQVLCENCSGDALTNDGIMGSEFMKKMSEVINLYNNLEYEEERVDELDYILLTTTISYDKVMQAELFQDSTNFGDWVSESSLTNKDIYSFPREREITLDNAQIFYKWASVMLGTPYSLPDINFRGLLGNLVTGKVVTTCVEGNSNKTVEQQDQELIEEIIRVEKKFSGEVETAPDLWDKILSLFNKSYTTDDNILRERLQSMFDNLGDPNSKYADLEPFVSLDYYDPNKQCNSGYMRKHTYTKFMNYDQYKVYLEEVYIPETFINCDECVNKNSSDYNKSVLAKNILKDIFEKAEYNRDYFGLSRIDYDNVMYGQQLSNNELSYMSSPIKSACAITSPYTELRGDYPHKAVDTIVTDGNYSLYAIAAGEVIAVNKFTTDNIFNTYNNGVCFPADGDANKNSGIEIWIKHTIDGKEYKARYAHLDPNGIEVNVGDKVRQGEKIANMGNTGCSSATHLHFELYLDNQLINPTYLFSNCGGSSESTVLKVKTTNNFVSSNKCLNNGLTLDEYITGIIKQYNPNAANNPEYIKSFAIVLRTNLMRETNWCNSKLDNAVNIDIENNSTDLMIYNYVVDTQGMVLNYSGEMIDNVDYADFPCEDLPVTWQNPGNRAYVLGKLGISDPGPDEWPKGFEEEVNTKLNEYNQGCINYVRNGSNVQVTFETMPDQIKEKSISIVVPEAIITSDSRDANNKFSTIVAFHEGKTKKYTQILNMFYDAKTEYGSGYKGTVDITTCPALIDAKTSLTNKVTNTTQGFVYGEVLPGTDKVPTGNITNDELNSINEHLNNYVNNASVEAESQNINSKRAMVTAAAYWLIYNPFYKVQYQAGHSLIHDNYNGIGWDPTWSDVNGLESSSFVLWSLYQAGANIYYPNESSLLNMNPTLNNGTSNFNVSQLIEAGVEPGDVLRRNSDSVNNWAIVMTVNKEQQYIEVAHAVNLQEDLKITRYYHGESFKYQYLYKLGNFYN